MDAVYLVAGEDDFLRNNAFGAIKDKILGHNDNRELNYKVFYAEDAKAQEVVDYLRTVNFLASQQVVLLRNFENFSPNDKKLILSYSRNPLKSSILILELTNKSFLKKDIYKELQKVSNLIDCTSPPLAGISRWIVKFATFRKKRISKEAIQLLVMNLGRNLNAQDKAIEKLSLFTGQRREITTKDVELLIGLDIDYSAYNLADAIGKKDLYEALKVIRRLAVNKNEAVKLLSRITWHFNRIYQAKELLKRGQTRTKVASYLNIPTFFIEKFIFQVSNYSLASLKKAFGYLLEADISLKTKKIKSGIVLESLAFRLCWLR